jgi:hypothetical protein
VISELSDFSVLQEEWRRKIEEKTIQGQFLPPYQQMSQVSLRYVHFDHLPQGLDLGEVAQARRHQRALFTQATFESVAA